MHFSCLWDSRKPKTNWTAYNPHKNMNWILSRLIMCTIAKAQKLEIGDAIDWTASRALDLGWAGWWRKGEMWICLTRKLQ